MFVDEYSEKMDPFMSSLSKGGSPGLSGSNTHISNLAPTFVNMALTGNCAVAIGPVLGVLPLPR